tara:strand:- start:422 stop:1198 length:777 start_codon:yes stop_codon:yes gene_type:complete
LYSKDGIFDFDLLEKIQQFPSRKYFEFFLKDFNNIKTVSNYWIAAQDRINLLSNETIFLKTHSALCTLENNPFTNKNNTKAAIYVVRDPRNLITSFSHHYSMNINESYNFITDKEQMLTQNEWGRKNFGIATILGNWAEHYKSWKNIRFAPILIVKYEDLISDTKSSFIKIINFLRKIMDIEINEKKIFNTINSCSFEKLSEKEKMEGFFEAVKSKKNETLNFFYLGKKNNWKKLLKPEIEKKIRETFNKEMKELGYY